MGNTTIQLDLLQRILFAPDARQLAAATLTAVQELVAGDYYSALTCDLKTRTTEMFHPGEGWLGQADSLVQTIQRTQAGHPFVQNFFPRGQSAVYHRGELLPDRQWQRTEIYNEVDRLLGIRDMVAIYQTTAAGQILVLTAGRSGPFRASDVEPARKLQQVLNALPAFAPPASQLPPPGAPPAGHLAARADHRLIPAGQSGVFFQPNEILCITADGNYTTLLTANKRKVTVRQTLAGWLAVLPADTFLQTDRATIVNLHHIGRLDFSARGATVRFDVATPALALGRNAAQKLQRSRSRG